MLFKLIDYYVWKQWNKCYSSLLIIMCDSSEINVIAAYGLLCECSEMNVIQAYWLLWEIAVK